MSADLAELRHALRGSIEALAESLLGEPNRGHSSRRTLRWGRKGSLALEIAGPKRGSWFSHEAGTGGDALSLVQHVHGSDFTAAVEWAQAWIGTPAPERHQARPQARPEPQHDRDRAAYAGRLWAAGRAVEPGSVGNRYLVETRAIPRPAAGWPADVVRFHPGKRALMFAATTATGDVQAVQLVFLDEQGRKAPIEVPKRSHGPQEGAAIRLPGKLPALLAEGPETGLSAWSATGHAVLIALGSVAKLEPPAFAVALADDDAPHKPADKARRRALRVWQAQGKEVLAVYPWPARRHDGSDFNDLIQAAGPGAVQARVQAALNPTGTDARRVPLPIAQVRLDQAVRRFIATAEAVVTKDGPVDGLETVTITSPVHAIRVDLGGGKSSVIRRELAGFVRRLRAAGDKRSVVVAVPEHKLAAEAAQIMAKLAPDLVVETWRGRGAAAPNRPGSMCEFPDRVADARKVRVDVIEFACNGCPAKPACEYLTQHTKTADIWFITSALLEMRVPAAIGQPAMVVVDETPALDIKTTVLPLLNLGRYDAIDRDQAGTERLTFLRRRVMDALAEAEDGPLTPNAFRALGMTAAESATELHALEWRTLVEPEPGDRARALREAARNADLGSRAMLALALKELLVPGREAASGLAELRTREDGCRDLVLHAPRKLHDAWRAAPTLILDGTLRMNLVHQTWPTAELIADVAIEAPHQKVRQCADAGFTLSALNADAAGLSDTERKRRERNLRRLRVMLHTEARRYAGAPVLVVGNKAVMARLVAMGLPANIETATFGGIRGIDRWRAVRAVVVVGWTLPPAGAVERLAGALTGVAVPATGYIRADATRLLADGTAALSDGWQHPDPLAEALRWSTCEAELLQSIARGRGVRRTAADPLDVLVLGEAVLPFPVEMVAVANPSLGERMLADHGVILISPADAAKAFPDLFKHRDGTPGSVDAAGAALADFPDSPLRESPIGETPGNRLVPVTYKPMGRGQQWRRGWALESALPGLADLLAQCLGRPVDVQIEVVEAAPAAAQAPTIAAPSRLPELEGAHDGHLDPPEPGAWTPPVPDRPPPDIPTVRCS